MVAHWETVQHAWIILNSDVNNDIPTMNGKHICHTKVGTKHSLNNDGDAKFVPIKPAIQSYQMRSM